MRALKRVTFILMGIIVGLIVLAVGSIVVDVLLGNSRVDALTNTRIANANGPEIRAFVARPNRPGPHPAVIMVHEWWGLKPDIVSKAEALAQEGYVVVAPDLFRGKSTSSILTAIYQVSTNSASQVDGDLNALYSWLTKQSDVRPEQIAIMGFCFGGGTALRYSIVNGKMAATVIFYGSPINDAEQLKKLKGPVLGIFGGADTMIPLAAVRAMEATLKQLGIPVQISVYEGQPHAFMQGIEEIRKSEPQQKAWNELLKFLKDSLQSARSAHEQPSTIAQRVSVNNAPAQMIPAANQPMPPGSFDDFAPARLLHVFVCDVAVRMQ